MVTRKSNLKKCKIFVVQKHHEIVNLKKKTDFWGFFFFLSFHHVRKILSKRKHEKVTFIECRKWHFFLLLNQYLDALGGGQYKVHPPPFFHFHFQTYLKKKTQTVLAETWQNKAHPSQRGVKNIAHPKLALNEAFEDSNRDTHPVFWTFFKIM